MKVSCSCRNGEISAQDIESIIPKNYKYPDRIQYGIGFMAHLETT